MKSTFSKALQKLYSILLFEKIEYQAPLAQLVSALAQETKNDKEYNNIWYQNDGDKLSYRMMRSDLKDV